MFKKPLFLFAAIAVLAFSIPHAQGAESIQSKEIDHQPATTSTAGVTTVSKTESAAEENPPVEMRLTIPLAAQGHEAIYQRFLNGALIYRPTQGSDVGMITLPIRELSNPLEGTFDLSRCGNTGNYLSISTGYRKGKKPGNASKVEIWLILRFLIEKEINTTAKHFKKIYPANWNADAPVGMFWTWGGYDDLSYMDYLTTESMDNLSKIDLYENWKKSRLARRGSCACGDGRNGACCVDAFMFRL